MFLGDWHDGWKGRANALSARLAASSARHCLLPLKTWPTGLQLCAVHAHVLPCSSLNPLFCPVCSCMQPCRAPALLLSRLVPSAHVWSQATLTPGQSCRALEVPGDCSGAICDLMLSCLDSNPALRPAAQEVVERVRLAMQQVCPHSSLRSLVGRLIPHTQVACMCWLNHHA